LTEWQQTAAENYLDSNQHSRFVKGQMILYKLHQNFPKMSVHALLWGLPLFMGPLSFIEIGPYLRRYCLRLANRQTSEQTNQ